MNHEKTKAKFSSDYHVVRVGKHNEEAKEVCSLLQKLGRCRMRAYKFSGCLERIYPRCSRILFLQ